MPIDLNPVCAKLYRIPTAHARRAAFGFCRAGLCVDGDGAAGWVLGVWHQTSGHCRLGDSSHARLASEPRPPRDKEFVSTGTIVVSNGLLHEQMLRVSREGDAAPVKLKIRADPNGRQLQLLGLLEFFPVQLYSYEFHVRKPSTEIFRIAAGKIAEPPQNILFVGDRIDNDVLPALESGMRAALKEAYTNQGKRVPPTALRIGRLAELPALIEQINASVVQTASTPP